MKNKRILIVLENDELGGAEIFAYDHAKLLNAKGYIVSIVFLFGEPNYFFKLNKNNDLNIDYAKISHRWSIFEVLVKFVTKKKYHNYDIIWSHLYFSIIYSRLIKLFYRDIKLISFLHDTLYHRNIRFPLWIKFTDFIYKKSFSLDNYTLSTSDYCKLEYKKKFQIKNIINYYGHVNENLINKNLLNFKDFKSKDFRILIPASLKKQKGHIFFIEALKKIRDENKNLCKINAYFAGSSTIYKKYLSKKIQEYELDNNIHFLGLLTQSQLYKEILKSNLIILPSVFEPMGTAILQSIFLKKNVLISDNTGIHKEISKFGINSFENSNSNELYYKIKKYINKNDQIKIDYQSFVKKFGMKSNLHYLEKYFNE